MRSLSRHVVALALAATLTACASGVSSGSTTVLLSPSPSKVAGVSDAGEPNGACGKERWPVKTGTDDDAAFVDLTTATPTTVSNLRILAPPADLPQINRIKPTETTVFIVSAELTGYRLEDDSDIHLILTDGGGNTMITEIPAPHCVGPSSPFKAMIGSAREQFDAKYPPTRNFTTVAVPIKVKGVGFFDFLHGQFGVAPNGIELHPVLDVSWPPTA